MTEKLLLRGFAWFWFAVFGLFAYFQLNDPDPFIWVPIYGYAAFVSLLFATRRYIPILVLLGMGFYLFYGLSLLPDDFLGWFAAEKKVGFDMQSVFSTTKAEQQAVEESREALGLLLAFVIMTVYLFAMIKKGIFKLKV